MPISATVTETDVTVASTTVPVRLDPSRPATRFWVEVVNPSTTARVFIGHTSGTTNVTNCATADPNNGQWEGPVGPNVELWALTEGGASISVRIRQHAT